MLIILNLSSCDNSQVKEEDWDDGTPKIRITVEENDKSVNEPKYFYRKYVRHYEKKEKDTSLNYKEEWYDVNEELIRTQIYQNGELQSN